MGKEDCQTLAFWIVKMSWRVGEAKVEKADSKNVQQHNSNIELKYIHTTQN